MIIINNDSYDKYERFISFDEGVVSNSNGKREGKFLYIVYVIDDKKICIETDYDYEWFKSLVSLRENDISNHVKSILYRDFENGWIDVMNDSYYLSLVKDNDKYIIKFVLNNLNEKIIVSLEDEVNL